MTGLLEAEASNQNGNPYINHELQKQLTEYHVIWLNNLKLVVLEISKMFMLKCLVSCPGVPAPRGI
jgi:hypothetical protein